MMTRTRSRALTAGASLALLVGAIGFAPAAAQTTSGSEAVTIASDGYDIPGTLAMPGATEGTVPAVLMLHGYGSSADEVGGMYAGLADALVAQGVGSLRIDFAGMGVSEASPLEYGWDSQTGDAATALDWLLMQEGVDPERVGVMGFSNGGMIGSYLVGTDERPAAFASWSGAIYDGEAQAPSLAPGLEQCEASGEGQIELDLGWRMILHSCDYFSSMIAGTALTEFANFASPLLLVAGSADTAVDPSVSENAATASASDDVTFELIEGADHIYNVFDESLSSAQQVIDLTADWFASKL
jgi:dienelactone hydrolase